MIKAKATGLKDTANASKKHLQARISFLHQAATCMTQIAVTQKKPKLESMGISEDIQTCEARAPLEDTDVAIADKPEGDPHSNAFGMPCHLLSHLRTISRKSQIRLSPATKNAICKRCGVLKIPGSTSTSRTENKSRGGKKPWADVVVVTCNICGTAKRFPVGAKRQSRRSERS